MALLQVRLLAPAVGRTGAAPAKNAALNKALRGVLDALLHHEHPLGPASGAGLDDAARLRLGPDSDEGLNVGAVDTADWAAALSESDAERAFTLPGLLEAVEAGDGLPLADVPAGLATKPLPYQRQGVGWMLRREALASTAVGSVLDLPLPAPRLHPAYEQLVAADGQVVYAHRAQGQTDAVFTLAQHGSTCGGCLCDEVGLGKTLEVLYLVLAHPAGAWAAESLPLEQSGIESSEGRTVSSTDWAPVPVRATLVVAPATLLDQWQAEIRLHAPTLKCVVYAGGDGSTAVQPRYVDGEGSALMIEGDDVESGKRRRRGSAVSDAPAAAAKRERDVRRPMLASSRALVNLFIAPSGNDRDEDGPAGTAAAAAAPGVVDVAGCDLILVSYETFHKELGAARSNFTVRVHPGRPSALSLFHSKSSLYGAFL